MRNSLTPLLVALAFALSACPPKEGPVTTVTPAEVEGLLRNDFATLVDVREPEEIAESGMAAGAVSIPMSKIRAGDASWKEFLAKTSKDKQLVFYCTAGGRAGEAAKLATNDGHRAANMGGFDDWVKAGLRTTKPAGGVK